MLIYVIGSIYYLVMTMNIGTPFRDSLTKEQLGIKQQAVIQRRNIFYTGCGIALLVVIIFRPFKKCS
tara:strand:- start:57 stop:257 length:201 start_codon:yes stop_codon:yes gene_type:complete